MTEKTEQPGDLTLAIERVIEAPRPAVWRCWTEPDLLKQWFSPKPWTVPEADLDLRPGGRMNVVMQGPEGERMELPGSYLEVVPETRLIFTDSFTEGFMPKAEPFMTGFVTLSDAEGGATRMVWGARHATADAMQRHQEMGFEQGWNAAADQLQDVARSLPVARSEINGLHHKARTCLFLADQAEAAARFYVSLLPDSRIETLFRPDPEGPPLVVEFTLAGTPFMSMNGNPDPTPSHLSSISILTADQGETDRLWEQLCAEGGEEGRCGWLKDRFGVHWQIVPRTLPQLLASGDPTAAARVSAALMTMKKIDIAGLRSAFAGKQQEAGR